MSGASFGCYSAHIKDFGSLLDKIDYVRHLTQGERDIRIPSVVVIGDQSQGKTSLLELISGIDLPRGDGTVTRVPLELQLRHCDKKSDEKVIISASKPEYDDDEIEESKEASQFVFLQKIDKSEISDKVKEFTNILAGQNKNVVDRPITLKIYSTELPVDLTMIDLPGLIQGSTNEKLPTMTRNMINRYIRNEETIIVNVIACDNDGVSSSTLEMARRYDPYRRRTLLAFTKVDRYEIDSNLVKKYKDTQQGNLFHGKHTIFFVRNRTMKENEKNTALQKIQRREYRFFQKKIANYSYDYEGMHIPKKCLGSKHLTKKLVSLQENKIKQVLPNLINVLNKRIFELEMKINSLPKEITSANEALFELFRIINQLFDSLRNAKDGLFNNNSMNSSNGFGSFSNYDNSSNNSSFRPNFHHSYSTSMTNININNVGYNDNTVVTGGMRSGVTSGVTSGVYGINNNNNNNYENKDGFEYICSYVLSIYEKFEDKIRLIKKPKDFISKEMLDELRRLNHKSRGFPALPGAIHPSIDLTLVRYLVNQIRGPSYDLINEVFTYMELRIFDYINIYAHAWPKLKLELRKTMNKILTKLKQSCINEVNMMIEREYTPFSLNANADRTLRQFESILTNSRSPSDYGYGRHASELLVDIPMMEISSAITTTTTTTSKDEDCKDDEKASILKDENEKEYERLRYLNKEYANASGIYKLQTIYGHGNNTEAPIYYKYNGSTKYIMTKDSSTKLWQIDKIEFDYQSPMFSFRFNNDNSNNNNNNSNKTTTIVKQSTSYDVVNPTLIPLNYWDVKGIKIDSLDLMQFIKSINYNNLDKNEKKLYDKAIELSCYWKAVCDRICDMIPMSVRHYLVDKPCQCNNILLNAIMHGGSKSIGNNKVNSNNNNNNNNNDNNNDIQNGFEMLNDIGSDSDNSLILINNGSGNNNNKNNNNNNGKPDRDSWLMELMSNVKQQNEQRRKYNETLSKLKKAKMVIADIDMNPQSSCNNNNNNGNDNYDPEYSDDFAHNYEKDWETDSDFADSNMIDRYQGNSDVDMHDIAVDIAQCDNEIQMAKENDIVPATTKPTPKTENEMRQFLQTLLDDLLEGQYKKYFANNDNNNTGIEDLMDILNKKCQRHYQLCNQRTFEKWIDKYHDSPIQHVAYSNGLIKSMLPNQWKLNFWWIYYICIINYCMNCNQNSISKIVSDVTKRFRNNDNNAAAHAEKLYNMVKKNECKIRKEYFSE